MNTDNEVSQVTEINEDNLSENQSQTQELFNIFPNNTNENVSHNSNFSRQNSTQSSDSESIYQSTSHNVTFITDNASDIGKAITKIGGYPWFGCAGHHLNLIAQAGFKQVEPAATLVKKCKRIVEHIRSSGPAAYLLIKYQKEFELPLHKVLQENNTR